MIPRHPENLPEIFGDIVKERVTEELIMHGYNITCQDQNIAFYVKGVSGKIPAILLKFQMKVRTILYSQLVEY